MLSTIRLIPIAVPAHIVYNFFRMLPRKPIVAPPRRRQASTESIVERIKAALIEHRLPPGAKLGEVALGEIFGVSRTKIRQALNRLAQDKLVTLLPARGAFVTRPQPRDARELFDARRVIERTLIERFTASATRAQIATLRDHITCERAAIATEDIATRNRLLGEFHVLIAEMAGNAVFAQLVRELVQRSTLVTLLYQSSRAASCSSDEHDALLDAIRQRDPIAAVRLMEQHLAHVERDLALPGDLATPLDLRAALATVKA
jgi:DNA-binding GntR family transcriptional regulator